MTDRCFICGEDNPTALEQHHKIPKRYGGTDQDENLETLCSNCHTAIEKMYDDRFFKRFESAVYGRIEDKTEELKTELEGSK